MLALLLTVLAAFAGQTSFDKVRNGNKVKFDVAWTDSANHADQVTFALPAGAIEADREELTVLPRRELLDSVAEAVRAYGRTLSGVKLTVTIAHGGVQVTAAGTGDVKAAIAGAEAVRDSAMSKWLTDNAFFQLEGGELSFDHARLASGYAEVLAPVAAALREGTPSDRAFVERALAFVQAIPYEARLRQGGDPGYRRPIALLARNRGDCDSKAVLFLGILRAELPKLPLAVVYVPNHALTGVGLEKESGDKDFSLDGVHLLYAEPVGPAMAPLGAKVPKDHKISKGEGRLVPTL